MIVSRGEIGNAGGQVVSYTEDAQDLMVGNSIR